MCGKALVSVLPYKIKSLEEHTAFKIYITDWMYHYGNNRCLTQRFYDIINPKPKDNRSAKEVIDDVIAKLGIEEENSK